MERGGVDLHQHPGGDAERFYLGCVQRAALDLVLLGQQEDKIVCAHVEFAVPVVLQAVQLGVPAPAHPQLNGHPAVSIALKLTEHRQSLQLRDGGLVGGALLRQGDGVHGYQQAVQFISLMHPPVGGKFLVKYALDLHIAASLKRRQGVEAVPQGGVQPPVQMIKGFICPRAFRHRLLTFP